MIASLEYARAKIQEYKIYEEFKDYQRIKFWYDANSKWVYGNVFSL